MRASRLAVAMAALATATLLGACGSRVYEGPGATTVSVSIVTPPSASPTTEPSTTTTVDPTEAITEVFIAFFDGTNTDHEAKLAMLEDPDAIAGLYETAREDPQFAPLLAVVTVDVRSVTATSPTTADVEFALLLDGAPATDGTVLGRAVLVDGGWRVANSTLCSLLALGNPAFTRDPACATR